MQWRGPRDEELNPMPSHVSEPVRNRSSRPNQARRCCSLHRHLEYSLRETPNQNYLDKPVSRFWPTKTVWGNKCSPLFQASNFQIDLLCSNKITLWNFLYHQLSCPLINCDLFLGNEVFYFHCLFFCPNILFPRVKVKSSMFIQSPHGWTFIDLGPLWLNPKETQWW